MAGSKKIKRMHIGKMDVSEKLFVGVAVTLMFLLLYLTTLDDSSFRPKEELTPEQRWAAYTPEEKIEVVAKTNQNINDATNYNAALLSEDRNFCNYIKDEAMKKDCYSEVPEYKEIPEDVPTSLQDVTDSNYFSQAMMDMNPAVCENIKDEALRNSCISETQG